MVEGEIHAASAPSPSLRAQSRSCCSCATSASGASPADERLETTETRVLPPECRSCPGGEGKQAARTSPTRVRAAARTTAAPTSEREGADGHSFRTDSLT